MQNKWDQAEVFAKRAGRVLNNVLDQAIFAEYSRARSYISAGDMGGSGTGSFVSSVANIPNLFTVAARKLNDYDVPQEGRFAVIGSRLKEQLQLAISGRETPMGDVVGSNGKVMDRYGFEIYYSNNLSYGATWTPANNPSNGGYITIAGVTYTFKTSPTAAGEIYIGSATADTLTSLYQCIGGTGTAGATNYIALSDKSRHLMTKAGIVPTDGTTLLSIVGYGDIVVTTSDSNDAWSAQTQRPLFGMKKAINFVLQKSPNVEFHQAELKLGKYLFAWQEYGKKTFEEDRDALTYAKCDASSWV